MIGDLECIEATQIQMKAYFATLDQCKEAGIKLSNLFIQFADLFLSLKGHCQVKNPGLDSQLV